MCICLSCSSFTQTTSCILFLLNRVENPSTKRKNTIITVLNISEVESRFYLYPFTCVAKNTDGINSAYIQLIHPGKQQNIWNEVLVSCCKIPWLGDLQCYFLCLEALGFLLTWQISILSLVSWTTSRKLSVLLPALNKLSAQRDEVSVSVTYFREPHVPVTVSVILSFLSLT